MLSRILLAAALLLGTPAYAQDYPTDLVRIIVPYAAGASTDILARIVGEKLSTEWGQPVIVENRPGAGGNIGAADTFNAAPDGLTLMATPPGPLVINESLYPNLRFVPKQFVPVSVIGTVPTVLVVNPKVEANTVDKLISYLKDNPDLLNYASQGNGTTSHLTAELFKTTAGVEMVHVAYDGASPALTDLMAGHVQIMFANLASALPLIQSGRLKVIAVAGATPSVELPDVPLVSETLQGFVSETWIGMVAPPETPLEIAKEISAAIAEVLKDPEIAQRMADLSTQPVGGTPSEMQSFMDRERQQWGDLIRSANVRID